jgi:hypothetical protein
VRFVVTAGSLQSAPGHHLALPDLPARRSVKSSGSSEQSSKESIVVHRLATTCGQSWSSGGLVPPGPLVGAASVAPKAAASSAMEGTSGNADPGLLRGRAGDAALGPGGVRVSDAFAAVTLRKRVALGPRAATLRGGGARVVGSSRVSLPHGSGPRSAGVSNRRCNGLMTRGVRADRVGVNPLSTTPARATAKEGGAGSESRRCPLARETSAGGVYGVRRGFGPVPYGETALPVPHTGIPILALRGGAQTIVRSCSRVVVVAEVDEQRLVQAARPWV